MTKTIELPLFDEFVCWTFGSQTAHTWLGMDVEVKVAVVYESKYGNRK